MKRKLIPLSIAALTAIVAALKVKKLKRWWETNIARNRKKIEDGTNDPGFM